MPLEHITKHWIEQGWLVPAEGQELPKGDHDAQRNRDPRSDAVGVHRTVHRDDEVKYDNPRELFENGGELIEGATITGASLGKDGAHLTLQLSDRRLGRFAVQIGIRANLEDDYGHVDCETCQEAREPRLHFEYDEPAGAGNDIFGRPDPRTHPEYWTE